jgi:hypothetical protein
MYKATTPMILCSQLIIIVGSAEICPLKMKTFTPLLLALFLTTQSGQVFGFDSCLRSKRWQPMRMTSEHTLSNIPEWNDNTRRSLLVKSLIATSTLVFTSPFTIPTESANAAEVRGPIELLRPATRIRLYIDQAVQVCDSIKARSNINSTGKDDSMRTATEILEPLNEFFQQEPTFLTEQESRLATRYLEIDTSSAWQKARRIERETKGSEIGIDYTTPYDKFNTAVQAWGDNRQFQILRARQLRLERANAMRAGFNAYTNNLVYGDAYRLNVDGDIKKALVRNDALPNVNTVVVSDLDLRDLYRNQVLQNVDDAKSEVLYQLKSGDVDVDGILQYLLEAQSSCKQWFSFVPKDDIEEALNVVLAEAKFPMNY